jgi:hypothetical protein
MLKIKQNKEGKYNVLFNNIIENATAFSDLESAVRYAKVCVDLINSQYEGIEIKMKCDKILKRELSTEENLEQIL